MKVLHRLSSILSTSMEQIYATSSEFLLVEQSYDLSSVHEMMKFCFWDIKKGEIMLFWDNERVPIGFNFFRENNESILIFIDAIRRKLFCNESTKRTSMHNKKKNKALFI